MAISPPADRARTTSGEPPSTPPTRPGPLGRLGRVAFRRRGRVILAWLIGLVFVGWLSSVYGGDYKADYSVAGSGSKAAQDLLEDRFPAQSGDTVDVVVQSEAGATDPGTRAAVTGLLDKFATEPHVASVEDPYRTPGGISPDGRTLVSHVKLDLVNPNDMPVEDTKRMLAAADRASADGIDVALGGQTIWAAEATEVGSEMIGILAAAVILLIMFGSVVAAGLPILVAVGGLALSGTLTGLVIAAVDSPDWSTSVATMLGLGIGIDYTLLMVTRFREWRAVGLDPEAATAATLDTAGRAVLVAGTTVVISMLGLSAMGLSYMHGTAMVTITAVLVVMVASVTLFPALLGYLGRHVDRLRLPLGRRRQIHVADAGHVEPSRRWLGWSRFVERHRVLANVAGVAILLGLASPFLGVNFGFPDAGNNREGTSTRTAYDALAEGFGPGANGPLLLAAELPTNGDTATLDSLQTALADTPGVASVTPPQVNPAGDTAVMTVVPTTGPQDPATEDLVHRLRDTTIPKATDGSGTTVYVGGVTASAVDSNEDIAGRIPLLIAGVVALSMLLLVVAFRSVVVAFKAATMNLLSVAAAYGAVALVADGGWAGRLVGIDTETPIPAFLPVIMFAVLFGLSMDYEVFLMSRMREAWVRTGDNHRAVTEGLAGTGRVITAAAAIMIAVFAAFVPSPDVVLKMIGVGMAAAILIDATVVRLLLVPAVMHLLGAANWWMPAWMHRKLPHFHVEGRPEVHLPRPQRPEPEPA